MIMKQIRHIATSYHGPFVALAAFEKHVQIYDIVQSKIISEIETNLDFGGRRLAIDEDGQYCICGSWEKQCISCYEIASGQLIWQRKDLKGVQRIQNLRSSRFSIFVALEDGPSRILDIKTGCDIKQLNRIKHWHESHFQLINLIGNTKRFKLVTRNDATVIANLDCRPIAVLDISFAPQGVVIANSAGPTSCYDTQNGKLKWKIPLDEDGHFLRIDFNENLGLYVGVTSRYWGDQHKKLKYINPQTGKIERELMLNCPIETEFALDGSILVTSNKESINIETGEYQIWM